MHTSLSHPERPGVSGNLRLNRERNSFPFVAVTWGVLGGSILRTGINTARTGPLLGPLHFRGNPPL